MYLEKQGHRFKQRFKLGFTLIEMIITIILISIISVVLGKVLFSTYQSMLVSDNIANTDWNAFVAIEKINNDIKTIRSSSDITTIAANNLVFTNLSGTSVQLQTSGTTLLRNSKTLATGVQSLTFGYLDANGVTTATPSLVRYISIAITTTQNNITTSFSTLIGTRGMP